jgi:hypothetical protein
MKHTRILYIISIYFSSRIETAVQPVQWVKFAPLLQRILQTTKTKEGADRLIVNGSINPKTLFVGSKGKVYPLLPELLRVELQRQDTDKERKKLRCSLKIAEMSTHFCGAGFGPPLIVGLSNLHHTGFSTDNICLMAGISAIAGLGASLYRTKKLYVNLTHEKFRTLDEWNAENRRVILAQDDKQSLLDTLRRQRCYGAISHLESQIITWYYPQSDWTKLIGHQSVHEEQILEPSCRTNPAAFPVVELRNSIIASL